MPAKPDLADKKNRIKPLAITVAKIAVAMAIMATLVFPGCAKETDAEFDSYRVKMEDFFTSAAYYDDAINAIDPQGETAAADLLFYLGELAAAISVMAAYEVPDSFPGVAELGGQAAQYMEETLRLYRLAYEDDFYDENIAAAAYENYSRANLRLHYIAEILRGETPAGLFAEE